jgi:hypothetical protein
MKESVVEEKDEILVKNLLQIVDLVILSLSWIQVGRYQNFTIFGFFFTEVGLTDIGFVGRDISSRNFS